VRKLYFAKIGLVVALATFGAAAARAPRAAAPAATCVQATQPAWIDYADKWVRFRRVFYRPGLAVTLAHTSPGAQARRRGAQIAYWDMSLKAAVGTPSRPGNPAQIPATAARLVSAAMKVTGCGTPIIALNELFGARLSAASSPTNAQYRANVLALVQALASRGAQPHLLISEGAATKGASAEWWRSVASVATIVREVYISAPLLQRLGSSGSTVYLRFQLRRAVRNFTTIGIPSSRVGLALGFHEGRGGRAGLSAVRWYDVSNGRRWPPGRSRASLRSTRCGPGVGRPSAARGPIPRQPMPHVSTCGRVKRAFATRRRRRAVASICLARSRRRSRGGVMPASGSSLRAVGPGSRCGPRPS